MRQKKKESSNLRIAAYFVAIFIFIVLVSLVFKATDTLKSSKFDSEHNFNVASIEPGKVNVISFSPSDKSLSSLSVEGADSIADLDNMGIPADAYIKSKSKLSTDPKSFFSSVLTHKGSVKTDLTVFDLIRLSFLSRTVSSENVKNAKVLVGRAENKGLRDIFTDKEIEDENVSVQITNAAGISGLGNKIANYIGNIGVNVVLVNSSPESQKNSKIYYKTDSYTVQKLSKLLKIPAEKKENASISDVLIIIGEDKEDF